MTKDNPKIHASPSEGDPNSPGHAQPTRSRSARTWTTLPMRTIRRDQLAQIVPLADTTIYDMEIRGEFPRRFSLTSRSVAWDLDEVCAWLEKRRKDSQEKRIRKAPTPDIRLRKTRPVRK